MAAVRASAFSVPLASAKPLPYSQLTSSRLTPPPCSRQHDLSPSPFPRAKRVQASCQAEACGVGSLASHSPLGTSFLKGTVPMSSHLASSSSPLRLVSVSPSNASTAAASTRGVRRATRAVGPIDLFIGLAVSMAGVAALAVPFMVFTTIIAGAATAFAFASLAIFAFPVVIVAMTAFSVVGWTIPFVWAILDKLLFLAVATNFIFGVIGLQAARNNPHMFTVPEEYRKGMPKNVRKWLTEEGMRTGDISRKGKLRGNRAQQAAADEVDLQKGFWILPSILSLVPGFHGAGWIAAFNDWPAFAASRWDVRAGLIRNALVYGGTGFLGLLLANPLAPSTAATVTTVATKCWGIWCTTVPVTVTAPAAASTGSFWLSLVLGAAHLQLDRAWLKQVAQARLGEPGGRGGKGGVVDVKATVSESELSKKDLDEFDARLRYRTTGGLLGEKASKWSTTEVGIWLEDNGFSDFVGSFDSHDITGTVLLSLNEDELRTELGMERLGQRKRLMLLVDELRRQQG